MPNPNTFDEASAATSEMFENEQLSLADVPPAENEMSPADIGQAEGSQTMEGTPDTGEIPTGQPESSANQSMLEQATQTAEIAAQVAAERDSQLQQVMAEVETLRNQNQQLQGTIDEMSRRNEQNIIEDALNPPSFNFNDLAFADEETIRAAEAKYAADMSEYTRNQIMKELSPVLDFAKQGLNEKEKSEAITVLSRIPELPGIQDMVPHMDKIIANNKWLQSDDMSMQEKYINAYAIARGVNSMNTPPPEPPAEPTVNELMDMYNSNPEFQQLVEKQRLEQIKQSQQVPPFSASSGAVNAALDIKDKPKTFEEASLRTRQMFGMD